MLKDVPYTLEEAHKAAGMGSYTLTSTKPLLPKDTEMNPEQISTKTEDKMTE